MDPASERRLIVLALQRMGGRLTGVVARRLPLNVGVETTSIQSSMESVAAAVLRLASAMGDVVEQEPRHLSWVVCGLVRNPAVVTVTLTPRESAVELMVRAAAAEGLIKQRTGQKTAAAVVTRLRDAVG